MREKLISNNADVLSLMARELDKSCTMPKRVEGALRTSIIKPLSLNEKSHSSLSSDPFTTRIVAHGYEADRAGG